MTTYYGPRLVEDHASTHESGGDDEVTLSGTHDEDHAARHADGGADELAAEDLASAGAAGEILQADGAGALSMVTQPFAFNVVIDGGEAEITTGEKFGVELPYGGEIESVRLLADQSGSIVVDIWKAAFADLPADNADSITASAPPTLSAAQKSEDETLTGWTTSFVAGDWLVFNVDSVTTIQRVTISLRGRRTGS